MNRFRECQRSREQSMGPRRFSYQSLWSRSSSAENQAIRTSDSVSLGLSRNPAFNEKDSCVKNRLGCRNLRRHSHLQTWWTHIFFFFDLHFFSFYRACLALRYCLSAPSCACQEFFLSFVSVDLRFTKRMTGKSRCEMRGCVYSSTQMCVWSFEQHENWMPASSTKLRTFSIRV